MVKLTVTRVICQTVSCSFDMWLTFRQMRVSQRRSAVGPGGGPLLQLGWRQKRFKWYALYSWGGPFIISLVTGELVRRHF